MPGDMNKLTIKIEVDDPAIIYALICRARGRKWSEACEEAQRETGRVSELRRQVIIQNLGKLAADAVAKDNELLQYAAEHNIGG